MFNVSYKGKRLVPTDAAMREMIKYGLDLYDCLKILTEGSPSPRKRSHEEEEIWRYVGNKVQEIVIIRTWSHAYEEEVCLVKHIGIFSRKKGRGRIE